MVLYELKRLVFKMSFKLERRIDKLQKEVDALKKELYTISKIKKDMRIIIEEVVKDLVDIAVEDLSVEEQLKEFYKNETIS